MCGLVGMYGGIYQKEKKAFQILLHLDVLRGPHSTGIAALTCNHKGEYEYQVFKELGLPENLYDANPRDFDKDGHYDHHQVKCLIGHNRFATQGGISKETAHPFDFDNVIGCHNGTVWQPSLRDFYEADKYKVDSQIIYSQISHDPDVSKVWKKLDGAAALTWWDKQANTLNIIRNKERTLYTCFSKDKRTMFWASEAWMLRIALGRANIDHDDPVMVKEHIQHVISTNQKGGIHVESHEHAPFVRPAYVAPPLSNYSPAPFRGTPKGDVYEIFEVNEYHKPSTGPEWDGVFFGVTQSGQDIRITIDSSNPGAKERWYNELMDNIRDGKPYYSCRKNTTYMVHKMASVHMSSMRHLPSFRRKQIPAGTVEGWLGEMLDQKTFEQDTKEGCFVCFTPIKWEDAADCSFFDKELVCCPTCANDPLVKGYAEELVEEAHAMKPLLAAKH